MKFVCLGYYNEAEWNRMTPEQQNGFMERCLAYDDELRHGGHFVGGEPLDSVKNAVTVRPRDGKAVVTDGPFVETKEQLGGLLMLEARDLNHAIHLMQQHPGVMAGGFEIRAIDEATLAKIVARGQHTKSDAPCGEVKPGEQHRWLAQFVGDWTMEGECIMGPDQPPHRSTGRETVRKLGDLWIMLEGQMDMPDGAEPARSVMTLGFDPAKGRFVGNFTASMMTYLWQYEGSLDAAGKVLTLDTVGPNFGQGGMARYQDIVERVDDDHRILRSRMLGDDGQWRPFMEARYTRVR